MTETKPYSIVLATLRLLAFGLWCIVATLYFFIAKIIGYKNLDSIPRQFHRGCCRILPLKVSFEGTLDQHRPTLYVCNHISYLDIFVLGGIVPGCFIAKSEVAGWPLLGQMARLQNTLFFERKGNRAKSQIQVMANHLSDKGNLILFPEGTSTDGSYVEPFKSSLFHAAEEAEDVFIQPVAISYTNYRGQPMKQATRNYFAWYADMPFASHFLKMAGMGQAQVKLIYHPAVKLSDFESRKYCADQCQRQIASSLALSLRNGSELSQDMNSNVDQKPGAANSSH